MWWSVNMFLVLQLVFNEAKVAQWPGGSSAGTAGRRVACGRRQRRARPEPRGGYRGGRATAAAQPERRPDRRQQGEREQQGEPRRQADQPGGTGRVPPRGAAVRRR